VVTFGAFALAIAFGTPGAVQRSAGHAPDTLRVVVVVDDTAAHRSLIRGATLGAEEAAHTGQLFDLPITTMVLGRAAFDSITRAAPGAQREAPPSIYIVAGDSLFCSRFVQYSVRARIPALDVGCPRTETVAATVYAIGSRTTIPPGDSTGLELWHSSLERFGAEQLNQRFRRRFDHGMDSDAWAGWFAMKVALDVALHAHGAAPSAMLAQLADPRASFDGQKGRPLRFAPATHRLEQPLYRVIGTGDESRVVGEVAP
jgi:hypothetical protein